MKPNGIKLNDEQVRRFICDGVIVLDSSLPPEFHQDVFDKMEWSNRQEFNMGNNVLPRIAELQQLLDDPVVHGAVQSVLGDDYMLHPHRYMHANEPLAESDRSPGADRVRAQPARGRRIHGKQRLAPGWTMSARPVPAPRAPDRHDHLLSAGHPGHARPHPAHSGHASARTPV